MILRRPELNRTYTLFPDTTLFRSSRRARLAHGRGRAYRQGACRNRPRDSCGRRTHRNREMREKMMERPSGKYYEELEVGHVFRHPLTRTVTETDNLLITTLTMNTQLLHLDDEFAKEHSVSGTRLVNSILHLGLVAGVGVSDVSNGTTVGNQGFKDLSFQIGRASCRESRGQYG